MEVKERENGELEPLFLSNLTGEDVRVETPDSEDSRER